MHKILRGMSWYGYMFFVLVVLIAGLFIYKTTKDIRDARDERGYLFQSVQLVGNLTRIKDNLNLFTSTSSASLDGFNASTAYYQAGTFTSGLYRGYQRIVAIREPLGPGNALVYILATKNRKSYVLHVDDPSIVEYPMGDKRNPFSNLINTKIEKTDQLPFLHPSEIQLSDTFSLYRESIVVENVASSKKNTEGYPVYEYTIPTSFPSYEKLASKSSTLQFYGVTVKPVPIPPEWEEDARVQQELRNKYIKGSTKVIVTDITGLPFSYTLTRHQEVDRYSKEIRQFKRTVHVYADAIQKFKNKETDTAPNDIISPKRPNLRFMKNNFQGEGSLFDTYDIGVPYLCSSDVDTPIVQNIKDDDLIQVGVVYGVPMFILKNHDHPFYKLAFRNKMQSTKDAYLLTNPNLERLSFEDYVALHPVFFFKDYWGRWAVLGESVYKIVGGC